MLLRRLGLLVLFAYVLWLCFAYSYHFIDGVNLAFHEAGHVFFAFFGQTLQILGGTILQLAFPIASWIHFKRRQEEWAATLCLVWISESLMYSAHYLADARAQILPLVGGHIHDWHWLLSRLGLLQHCEEIGWGLHLLASLLAVGALLQAGRRTFGEEKADMPARPPTPGP
jgi:hypothetical protein